MRARRKRSPLGIALILAVLGCRSDFDPATGPGEMGYGFLQSHVEEALRHVEDARAAVGGARPAESEAPLEEASVGLRKVLAYYLPLLEVRFRVARAMDIAATRPAAGSVAVDSARAIVETLASSHGEQLGREMQETLARFEEARTALDSDRPREARQILRRLDEQLELLYFRGEIVLEGSDLDSPPPKERPD